MNTGQIWRTATDSLSETLNLAAAVGRKLKGGEVIELISDLGGGKTAFVRGLASGLGSGDHVHSPSFTLSNQYKSRKLNIYHFDLHRLDNAGLMREELSEILADQDNVVVIEWAEIVKELLPYNRLTIRIKALGENKRELTLKYPPALQYLIPAKT